MKSWNPKQERNDSMPVARIDMNQELKPRMKEISDAIHAGMVSGLAMIPEDLFQIFRLHGEGELVYSRTFPNADRTDIVFVEILATRGYPDEVKAKAMREIAANIRDLGIKPDNLLFNFTDVGPGDWHAPEVTHASPSLIAEETQRND
jgi:hypothetical protein